METLRESGIKLLADRVVLKKVGVWCTDETTKGVIKNENGPSSDFELGTVEAIGEGNINTVKTGASSVQVGDYVVYNPVNGLYFTFNGETYNLRKEDGIIGIVPPPSKIK